MKIDKSRVTDAALEAAEGALAELNVDGWFAVPDPKTAEPTQQQVHLRDIAQHVLTFAAPYIAPTLPDEVAELRESLEIQTTLLEEARAALDSVKYRMDEFAYDELSSPLSDGARDPATDDMIRSRTLKAEIERDSAMAVLEKVRLLAEDWRIGLARGCPACGPNRTPGLALCDHVEGYIHALRELGRVLRAPDRRGDAR